MNFLSIFSLFIAGCTTRVHCAFQGDGTDDLPLLAQDYAKEIAKNKGTTFLWVDLYRNRSELEEYPAIKTEVWAEDMEYEHVERAIEEPSTVYTQRFVNDQNTVVKVEFTRKIEMKNTFTWTSSTKFNVGYEVKAKVSVPAVLDVTGALSTGLEISSGKSETKEETETYEAKHILEIPKKKTVIAELVVTKKNVKVPWTANIHITGYFAFWTYDRIKLEGYDDYHYLHFKRIDQLKNSKYLSDNAGGLIYKAKGTFKGLKGFETYLKVTEVDVGRGKRGKVTIYKPELRKLN